MVSDTIPKYSPLLRGLGSVLCSAIICDDILESGAACLLGSHGMGLFGSLESQFGMLLCLWIGMSVEKELRLMPFGSSGTDMVVR